MHLFFKNKFSKLVITSLFFLLLTFTTGCTQQPENLIVYSGKGLKFAVDEIIENFENREGISVSVVYAGSKTLLDTIKKTHKGDIYIPGSEAYIKDGKDLISHSEFVAYHVPTFIVSSKKSKEIKNFEDLFKPGVRIAVGNKRMAAIGRISEEILNNADLEIKSNQNIVITASTVNELIQLVAKNEVDAALIWRDMMEWDIAEGLTEVTIPDSLNKPKKVFVASLSTSINSELSDKFLRYASSDEGRSIFKKHGFVK